MLIPELRQWNYNTPFLVKTKVQCTPFDQLPHDLSCWDNFLGAPWDGSIWYRYGNEIYILGTPKYQNAGVHRAYWTSYFSVLTGADQLDGKNWGPISTDDIMLSCLAAYTQNGYQNGWARANPQDSTTLDDIIQHGIAAPGVWPFPICGMDEMTNNALAYKQEGEVSKNYLCD